MYSLQPLFVHKEYEMVIALLTISTCAKRTFVNTCCRCCLRKSALSMLPKKNTNADVFLRTVSRVEHRRQRGKNTRSASPVSETNL